MVNKLKKDDVVFVKSIDRFGRNYKEILEQWRLITKDKSCNINVIDMPLLNTTKYNDLIGTLISDIILQLLSFVAETERDYIKQRQKEGIILAKNKGVVFGRKPKVIPNNFIYYKNLWIKKEINSRTAATFLNVSHNTFIKWCKEN